MQSAQRAAWVMATTTQTQKHKHTPMCVDTKAGAIVVPIFIASVRCRCCSRRCRCTCQMAACCPFFLAKWRGQGGGVHNCLHDERKSFLFV